MIACDLVRCLSAFFTAWYLVVLALPPLHRYFDIVFLAVVVSIGGAFLTYVWPRKYVFEVGNRRVVVSGRAAMLADALTHQLPLVLVLVLTTYAFDVRKLAASVGLIIVYCVVAGGNLRETYQL